MCVCVVCVCMHACVCWFVIDTVRQLSERTVVFMHNCIKQDSPLETIQLISHSVIFLFPISVTLCVCVCVCVRACMRGSSDVETTRRQP